MIKNVHVVLTFTGEKLGAGGPSNRKYEPCVGAAPEPDIVIPPQPLKSLGVHTGAVPAVTKLPVKWLDCPDLSFQEETVDPLAGRTPVPAGSSPSNHTMQLGMFVGENGRADNGLNT